MTRPPFEAGFFHLAAIHRRARRPPKSSPFTAPAPQFAEMRFRRGLPFQ
ncbi:MAG: hypothetical protein ACREWI_06745 [Telluria sp.]